MSVVVSLTRCLRLEADQACTKTDAQREAQKLKALNRSCSPMKEGGIRVPRSAAEDRCCASRAPRALSGSLSLALQCQPSGDRPGSASFAQACQRDCRSPHGERSSGEPGRHVLREKNILGGALTFFVYFLFFNSMHMFFFKVDHGRSCVHFGML